MYILRCFHIGVSSHGGKTISFVLYNEQNPNGIVVNPYFANPVFPSRSDIWNVVFSVFPNINHLSPAEYFGRYEIFIRNGSMGLDELITEATLNRSVLGGDVQVVIRRSRYSYVFEIRTFHQEYSRKWLREQCCECNIAGEVNRTDVVKLEGIFYCHDPEHLSTFIDFVTAEVSSKNGVIIVDGPLMDNLPMDYHFVAHHSGIIRDDGVQSWGAQSKSEKASVKTTSGLSQRITRYIGNTNQKK